MKLSFLGAARAVTGSCHMLTCGGKTLLIDCGMQQGADERDNASFPFDPAQIDYVVVTHAHIDHSGRLPLLVKNGFAGKIITTRLTRDLLGVMLRDSAHIQAMNIEYENRRRFRAGRDMRLPLFSEEDVANTLALVSHVEYGEKIDLDGGITLRFVDAGHMLGSASVEVWAEEAGETRKLVFSGDIGNVNQPIIHDPQLLTEADYVIMESTYGDHNLSENEGDYTEELAALLDRVFANGGSVIIPASAVGRAQEVLYVLRTIKERGLVKSLPDFPVYLDSPLGEEITQVFMGDLNGYLDDEALKLADDGRRVLTFPNLHFLKTTDESKTLNHNIDPKVVIASSGSCDAGRSRHYLKHYLWRPGGSAFVFIGKFGTGSVPAKVMKAAETGGTVKVFGEEIIVRIEAVNYIGISSHAGLDELVRWASAFDPKPRKVFVVHGDEDVAVSFADRLGNIGIPAYAPVLGEEYDLITGNAIAK